MEAFTAWPWAIAVIGGPILLGLALVWGRSRSGKAADRADPDTSSDDPSKGL